MFRISTLQSRMHGEQIAVPPLNDADVGLLSQFCVIDRWSASLHNAMLHLGSLACRLHGLENHNGRCGLLEFVRCYDPQACHEIIALFEQAAAGARPFQYSAELKSNGSGRRRLVHCFGDFRQSEAGDNSDELFGVFLFSRNEFVSC